MLTYLIPYNTAEERKVIMLTLYEHDNDENRLSDRFDIVYDTSFKSYKQKSKPRGERCITWYHERGGEGTLDYVNARLRPTTSKRAYVVTPSMEKHVGRGDMWALWMWYHTFA